MKVDYKFLDEIAKKDKLVQLHLAENKLMRCMSLEKSLMVLEEVHRPNGFANIIASLCVTHGIGEVERQVNEFHLEMIDRKEKGEPIDENIF